MENKQEITVLVAKTMEGLRKQEYTEPYLRQLHNLYEDLQSYMSTKGTRDFSMNLGLSYLYDKYGISADGFYGKQPRKVQFPMRALLILWDYAQYGFLLTKARAVNGPFEWPVWLKDCREAYLRELKEKGNALSTQNRISYDLRKFILFLTGTGVSYHDGITGETAYAYLSSLAGCQPSHIATTTRHLRRFLCYCYERRYMQSDVSKSILPTKASASRMLPSSWMKEELRRTLNCIDRESMTGKRDYAIVLLVARLGLRASDVCDLKISDIDWKARRITLVMQKTKRVLNLPLLEDVGWALIDYLKNTRPQTNSQNLFIRLVSPYTKLNRATLSSMVGWYLNKAGIDVGGRRHGLHSFRNTLAKAMLESGASLPVISEVLGHHNIQTTSIYLSVDIEGLKNCIIDPEGVFSYDA